MPVEEELKRVNDYADQIIRNPTSSIVTPDLRRIARTTREKVYDALAAMSPLKGVSWSGSETQDEYCFTSKNAVERKGNGVLNTRPKQTLS